VIENVTSSRPEAQFSTLAAVSSLGGLSRARARERVNAVDRIGNRALYGLCAAAAVLAGLTLGDLVYQVVSDGSLAIGQLGLPFLFHTAWAPNFGRFGAAVLIYGTLVSSFMALLLAIPIGVAIGLYLSLLAPRRVAGLVGPLVEMLAAIPSVIVGFWGVIVLAPFMASTLEPFLHGALGFIPLFGTAQTTGVSVFTASIVLTIMILPIIASLSRDLFLTVPGELKDGAAALGATTWEVIRGVVLPTTVPGVAAASVLALGRALGEAIAVAQVIGAGSLIHANLFDPGSTLASRIALQFTDAASGLHQSALFYCAVILLVLGVVSNLSAQAITSRFGVEHRIAK
jgi:phosphate transport system permease protein